MSTQEIHPVRSMTGFARSLARVAGCDLEIELRSVNQRFFELIFRAPREFMSLEREARQVLQAKHRRGRFELSIFRPQAVFQHEDSLQIDPASFDAAIAAYSGVCARFGLGREGLSDFIGRLVLERLNDKSAQQGGLAQIKEQDKEELTRIFIVASDSLLNSRSFEGAALVADISARVTKIGALGREIANYGSNAPDRLRARLSERLEALRDDLKLDPNRLALEVALLAERVDTSEEVVRLAQHLELFSQVLSSGHPDGIGRRLDFITQEIARELNTIGSKAQDSVVQGIVVGAKSELERVREQVQNIE